MDLIKSLLNEFELDQVKPSTTTAPVVTDMSKTKTDDNGIAVASQVQKGIDREAKFDEVDTVTFGLETEDGEIVKVYVNAEYADEFEKELGAKLGEEDSIEQVLNDVAKAFANRVGEEESVIVDVEWPDDEEDEDDEMLGSESLNQDLENAGDDAPEDQSKTNEETNMATYGEQFTKRILEAAEGEKINVSQTAVGGDISYILEQLGVSITAEAFLPGIKTKLAKTVRSFDGSQKQAIRNFRRVIERLEGGESKVEESFEGELVENENREDMLATKLRLASEKNIFNAIRFLILGADQSLFVTDLIRPTAVQDVVDNIKTSKFKTGQYRNALKMFLSKIGGGNVMVKEASASFNRDEKDTEAGFKENDDYTKIAGSDPCLKMVLEVLAYFGFSDRILNHSDIKRELTVDVRRKMRKIVVSSDGRRLKMLFGWGDRPGLIKMVSLAKSGPVDDTIKEERWTDTSSVGEVDADVEIADATKGAAKKDETPQEVTWDVKSGADAMELDNGSFKIVMDAEQSEKLVSDLGDGKKAIVIKDTEGAKFIFAATQNNEYVVSEKGKHQKFLLSSKDIDKITK